MPDAKLTALTGTSVPDLLDLLYAVDVSDTTDDAAGSSRSVLLSRLMGLAGVQPGGRLTTEAGVGVSTADRTLQSTIRYTPFLSDYMRMYDGTRIKEYSFVEPSLVMSGLTSGKNYDMWMYDSSGTPTLDMTVWTNDSTRATALAWQAGLGWVKSGTPTRLYLGTIRSTSTTQTEDSETKRFVWNANNRQMRSLRRLETTASWSTAITTPRQANGAAANQVEVVAGLAGESVHLSVACLVVPGGGGACLVGIGEDSTTAWEAATAGSQCNIVSTAISHLAKPVPLGYHYYAWLEKIAAAAGTFYGVNDSISYGLTGDWPC